MPLGGDVVKTGVVQPAFEKRAGARFHAAFSGGLEECGVEEFGSVAGCEGTVWRVPFQVEIDAFDPAAWFGMSGKTEISGHLCACFRTDTSRV